MKRTIAIAAMILAGQAAAATGPANFRCPETLPSDQAREKAATDFVDWVAQTHGNQVTVDKVVRLRMQALQEHGCRLPAGAVAPEPPPTSQRIYFVDQRGRQLMCLPSGPGMTVAKAYADSRRTFGNNLVVSVPPRKTRDGYEYYVAYDDRVGLVAATDSMIQCNRIIDEAARGTLDQIVRF